MKNNYQEKENQNVMYCFRYNIRKYINVMKITNVSANSSTLSEREVSLISETGVTKF
jgi:macrodomain Ter protein organizer (MatP/YcbG family)